MTEQFKKGLQRIANSVTSSKQKKKYLVNNVENLVKEELKRYGIQA